MRGKENEKTAPSGSHPHITLSCSDSNQMDAFLYLKKPQKHLFSVNVLTLLSQFDSLLTAHLSTPAKADVSLARLLSLLTRDTPVTGFCVMTQQLLPLILWKFSDTVFTEKSVLRVSDLLRQFLKYICVKVLKMGINQWFSFTLVACERPCEIPSIWWH